jgi:hypothetical protein
MRRSVHTIAALGCAAALIFAAPGTASATPSQKGHTEIQSDLLALAPLIGIQVDALNPATKEGNTFSLPIVDGGEHSGGLKHVGGISLTIPGVANLTTADVHHDLETDEVSVVVNDDERVHFFDATMTSPMTAMLALSDEGAAIITELIGNVIPGVVVPPGFPFGTATILSESPGMSGAAA